MLYQQDSIIMEDWMNKERKERLQKREEEKKPTFSSEK